MADRTFNKIFTCIICKQINLENSKQWISSTNLVYFCQMMRQIFQFIDLKSEEKKQ